MKKVFFALLVSVMITACGSAYNKQLNQVELGMTPQQIVSLMGNKYTTVEQKDNDNQTIMYADRYKNLWYFKFVNGHLNKWYKETE